MAARALTFDPDEPWARTDLRTDILSGSGHHDRALEQFRAALDASPELGLRTHDVRPCASFALDISMRQYPRRIMHSA